MIWSKILEGIIIPRFES
uniref:Uncharacterized protein n=1 Tax=Arundo donax TaxID=35708 RepID=A0A0A9C223_ARUDO